ncbi:MAG TPA: flagellar hook-basal body complex protein FliE [Stellaceae bacterium]|nr:flagellar hook-basal body complex protein FliE [Stellaceae bacterium]
MIEAVTAMNAVLSELTSLAGTATAPSSAQLAPDVSAADAAQSPSFMQALRNAIGSVDSTVSDANTAAKAFSAGDKSLALSDVMVSLEQANLAMQMASQVRDKVVSAYTNVMNMQV